MKSSIALLVLVIAAVVAFEVNAYQSDEPHHTIVARATRGCDPSGCNQFCRKLEHARGVCIGSLCQCRSRLRRSIPQMETQNLAIITTKADYDQNRASQKCNAIMIPTTLKDIMKDTDHEYAATIDAIPKSIPKTAAELSEQKHTIVRRATGCGAASCNRLCQKQGHARGVCIGSYCQCRFQ